MYPELVSANSLAEAIQLKIQELDLDLKCARPKELDDFPVEFAIIEKGNKFSQIYIGGEKRIFLPDFWRNGVCLANGGTDNLNELVKAIDLWINSNVSTENLTQQFGFIEPDKCAQYFDNQEEIEYKWNIYLNDEHLQKIGMVDFMLEAIKVERIKNLFPFTSVSRLCLSQTTGYPYQSNFPIVVALENKMYQLRDQKNTLIVEGDLNTVLNKWLEFIPSDIARARPGTADD